MKPNALSVIRDKKLQYNFRQNKEFTLCSHFGMDLIERTEKPFICKNERFQMGHKSSINTISKHKETFSWVSSNICIPPVTQWNCSLSCNMEMNKIESKPFPLKIISSISYSFIYAATVFMSTCVVLLLTLYDANVKHLMSSIWNHNSFSDRR